MIVTPEIVKSTRGRICGECGEKQPKGKLYIKVAMAGRYANICQKCWVKIIYYSVDWFDIQKIKQEIVEELI